jgi:hypothetical protein
MEPTANNKLLFDRFYEENKGAKLRPTHSYGINIEQLNSWARDVEKSGSPMEIVQFSRVFAQNLLYIDFEHFHMKLNQVAHDIRAKVIGLAPTKVYAIIDGTLRKSNTWVALLVWDVLTQFVTHVVSSVFEIPDEDFREDIAIVHMDDMSYSGKQMGDTVRDIVGQLRPESSYFILVPYIGKAAKTRLLKRWPYLKFSMKTTEIKTLEDFINEQGYDSKAILAKLNSSPWNVYYGAKGTHNLVYFNHKLADAVSVPNKMLAGLYVVDNAQKVSRIYHAIHNCEDALYTQHGEQISPDTEVTDFDDNNTCPLAFYKNIDYTFNGVHLKNSDETAIAVIKAL